MKEIIINTQKEFDALKDFDVETIVNIKGEIYEIKKCVKNGLYYLSGNATVQYVSENATVQYVYENATVQSVSGNATVQSVYGNATVKIYGNSVSISAAGRAIVIAQDCKPKVKISGHATLVNTITEKHSKQSFLDIYPADNSGYVTLYKSVNPETHCDFKTGKIKYEGDVICPDWKENYTERCGYGLHLSPLPIMALQYNQGKILKCLVHKDDFAVHPDDITKVRCKKVTVLEEVKP